MSAAITVLRAWHFGFKGECNNIRIEAGPPGEQADFEIRMSPLQ
jgi:hypothetical protein